MESQVETAREEQVRARGRPASPTARCRIRVTARQATARRRFSSTLTRSLGFQLSCSAKFRRIRERKRSRLLRNGRKQPDAAHAVSVDIWQMPLAARESSDLRAGRGSLLRAASFAYACSVCGTPSGDALTLCGGCMCRCESSAQHARHCWLFLKARQSSSVPSAARCRKFRRVLPRLRRPQQASAALRPEMSSHTAGRSARQRMAAPTLSTTTRDRAPGPILEPTRQPPPRLCRTLLPRQQATQATGAAAPMGFPILLPWHCPCSRCCRRARLNSLRGWTKRIFRVARFVPLSSRL